MKGLMGSQCIGACRPGYFKSCILTSRGQNTKTRGHLHIAYACTDVRIAYSVLTKYTFHNCASNASVAKFCPGTHTGSAGAYGPVKESITQLTMYCIIHLHKFQLTMYKYKIKLHSSGRKSVLVFVGNCRPSFYIRQTMLKRI